MANAGLEVRESGRTLRVHTDTPHLVSTGSGRLSTSVTLHPLPEGRVIVGSSREADVQIPEAGVEFVHCVIENTGGSVTLHPVTGNTCVDGVPTVSPTRLTQGCTLTIGKSSTMRFNNPAEAKQLKANGISQKQNGIGRKPPQVPKRTTTLQRLRCNGTVVMQNGSNGPPHDPDEPEINFLGKLSKFELLARQARAQANNFCQPQISPKVFPSNSLTTSVPADQILVRPHHKPNRSLTIPYGSNGYHRAPNHQQHQNPFQNLTNFDRQQQTQQNGWGRNANCWDEGDENVMTTSMTDDLMTRSLYGAEMLSPELHRFSRDFDMSQSLIVAKTTTCQEFLGCSEDFGIGNDVNGAATRRRRAGSYEDQGSRDLGSYPSIRKLQPPSPSFDRDIRYNQNLSKSQHEQIPPPPAPENHSAFNGTTNGSSPTPSSGGSSSTTTTNTTQLLNSGYTEDGESSEKEAETRRRQAQEERVRDQELERQEKLRLEEILAMCAEYERQSQEEEKQKRKLQDFINPPPPPPPTTMTNGCTQTSPDRQDSPIYSNVEKRRSPTNNVNNNNFECHNHSHQNHHSINGHVQKIYENLPVQQQQQHNNINNNLLKTPPPKPKRATKAPPLPPPVENRTQAGEKLDVSNDDLLEAIEQLSMLSQRNSRADVEVECPKEQQQEHQANGENGKAENEGERYLDFLRGERKHILDSLETWKKGVEDVELREEDVVKQLDTEKTDLTLELESETAKLAQAEAEKSELQAKIKALEDEMAKSAAAQAQAQAEARDRVQRAQQLHVQLEDELTECRFEDEGKREEMLERLQQHNDELESERKSFEDLEFRHLEEESSKLANREELQRCLGEVSTKIDATKSRVQQLEVRVAEVTSKVGKESKSLERKKLGHLRRIEEGRNRLRAIEEELEYLGSGKNGTLPSMSNQEDYRRIVQVTTDSPIIERDGTLGRKTLESLREIEKNRRLHLAKQGGQVISEERRRVEELKRRVQDEVRSEWEERKMNCTSLNSVESGEESSSYGPTESGSGSSDGADNGQSEKFSSPGKFSEFASSSPGPSGNSYTMLQAENMSDERSGSTETERYNGMNGSIVLEDVSESRPMSQTSSELETMGSVRYRDKPKLQRPLTRYLPIKSENLDLRYHIETAGHQLALIHDVNVDTTSCSGYLSKMSKKFHHWNKRWFIFDRKRKILAYYSDRNSKKPRGIIYFQSIEEVYVDHLNTVKSPQPSLTFIVKTSTRMYHFMAPSAESMRVWVDVIFTGAEGYQEFDQEPT